MSLHNFNTHKDFCPSCGHEFDSVSRESDEKPEPGDYSVCLYCLAVLEFDADLILARIVDASEWLNSPWAPSIKRMRLAVALARNTQTKTRRQN
jgi:hypothetical protein